MNHYALNRPASTPIPTNNLPLFPSPGLTVRGFLLFLARDSRRNGLVGDTVHHYVDELQKIIVEVLPALISRHNDNEIVIRADLEYR